MSDSKAQQDQEEHSTEGKVAEWLSQNGRNSLYALAALAVILAIAFRWGEEKQSSSYQDFVNVEKYMQSLRQDEGDQLSVLTEVESILDRHEELKPKYEGRLAHYFLRNGNVDKAAELLHTSLERSASVNGSFHHAYSENTLRIAAGDYTTALTAAEELQKELDALEQPSGHPEILVSFNLLRIAILQQQVNNPEAEKVAWKAFRERSTWLENTHSKLSPNLHLLSEHFAQGSVRLNDYIKAREEQIN